jgi:hypothetical protein
MVESTIMKHKKPQRKKVIAAVVTAVLAKSARRCALCFFLTQDVTEKAGQIAHLDGDRANGKEDNLAWMCLEHHSLYDSKTKQHKNYTVLEVKAARRRLYDFVAKRKYVTPLAAQPYLQAAADKEILRDFLLILPSNGSIKFLRHHNFAASFAWKQLEDIDRFCHDRSGPDHEFLDPELQTTQIKFRESCQALLASLARNTFTTHHVELRHAVPAEWEEEQPERFDRVVEEIHKAAKDVCRSYNELVKLARRTLAV